MCKHSSNGFVVGSSDYTYDAQVQSVKDDRVTFWVTNIHGKVFIGTYYLPKDCRINPHVVFKTGAFWQVKIVKLTKHERYKKNFVYTELNIEVDPQNLPVDLFAEQHPPGSIVVGKVIEIIKKGAFFLISLAENVFCIVRRNYHIATGSTISCKITGYNTKHKVLSVVLV